MMMIALAHAQEVPLWSVSPVVGGELIVFPLLRAIHIFTLGRPNPIVGGQTLQHPISTFLSIVFPLSCQLYFPFPQCTLGKLVEIPRWIKVSCPLTSACVNDQFLPRIGFHRAICDQHCLRSRRHLAYCHFFASIVVVTYLALSRCQGRSSRHTGAIIKPLDKQTIKDFYTFMAIVSL